MSSIGLGDAAFMSSCANICGSAGSDSYGIDQFMMATSFGGMFSAPAASSMGLFGDSSRWTSAIQGTPMETFAEWNAQGAIAFDGGCFCITGQGMGTGAVGGGGAGTGAGGVNPAGAPNIDASTDADETDAASEAHDGAIDESNLDSARTTLTSKGYGGPDIEAIIEEIEGRAGGDESLFDEILREVPPKTDNEDWLQQFGEWHQRWIHEKSESDAEDFVHRTAFDPEVRFTQPSDTDGPYVKLTETGTTQQINPSGDGKTFVSAQLYRVTGSHCSELADSTTIYKVTADGTTTYYREVGGVYQEVPFYKRNSKYFIDVADDGNIGVTQQGEVVESEGHTYTPYTIDADSAVGGSASRLVSHFGENLDGATIYRSEDDGKWYYMQPGAEGTPSTFTQIDVGQPGAYEDNDQLVWGQGPVYLPAQGFYNSMPAQRYIDKLHAAAGIPTGEAGATGTAAGEETADAVAAQLTALFGEGHVTVASDGSTIEITDVSSMDAAEIRAKLESDKSLLSELGDLQTGADGTSLTINGQQVDLTASTSEGRVDAVIGALDRLIPATTENMDLELSLSDENFSDLGTLVDTTEGQQQAATKLAGAVDTQYTLSVGSHQEALASAEELLLHVTVKDLPQGLTIADLNGLDEAVLAALPANRLPENIDRQHVRIVFTAPASGTAGAASATGTGAAAGPGTVATGGSVTLPTPAPGTTGSAPQSVDNLSVGATVVNPGGATYTWVSTDGGKLRITGSTTLVAPIPYHDYTVGGQTKYYDGATWHNGSVPTVGGLRAGTPIFQGDIEYTWTFNGKLKSGSGEISNPTPGVTYKSGGHNYQYVNGEWTEVTTPQPAVTSGSEGAAAGAGTEPDRPPEPTTRPQGYQNDTLYYNASRERWECGVTAPDMFGHPTSTVAYYNSNTGQWVVN